ncbi:MAG: AarF/ABC1/UbiB kinase family protein [Planctomycetes bacterium]|nr:AarF/ABC1/UbiB kinase family protein [Planctomycetota bacterium]
MPLSPIAGASRIYRHVNRYRQILAVLFRYGFGEMLDRLHIHHYLESGLQMISREKRENVESLTTAQRVRMSLEELGPTFIKLGQVLSTRPDLVPAEFVEELSKLQQHVPPFAFEQVRKIIEAELKKPVSAVFSRFDEQCLASASIGQVHRARLVTGEEVVVKVQRPGIHETIEADLEILAHLASIAERHLDTFKLHRPTRVVVEFRRAIEREQDFTTEAAHQERFANLFRGEPTLRIPRVYRNLTTSKVLTVEYLDILPISSSAQLRAAGLDPKRIAEHGTQLTLRQIFVFGFFHADPHPGNIFALPGDVICLVDFGMVGRLDRQAREDFADLVYAISTRDASTVAGAIMRIAESDDDGLVDMRMLERDVAEFLDINITERLADLEFGKLLHEMLRLTARHQLRIPADMVMMLKAAATAERVLAELDPDLNLVDAARPYLRKLKVDRYRPFRVLRDLSESGALTMQLLREIPGGVRDILRLAKRGHFRMGFEHRGLDRFVDSNERIANRISFAIVVAALIVGSSLIVNAQIPPKWNEIPVIGLLGYLAAGVMGILLLIAIIRHGLL